MQLLETLKNINQIIERESKTSTYKFALLRSTIEVVQEKYPQIIIDGNKVRIPVGLLVVKWLKFYYPLFKNDLPQINNNTKPAFYKYYQEVIDHYKDYGNYSAFYKDLVNDTLPSNIKDTVYELCKCIRDTIKKQPMRYIGNSVYDEDYSIFTPVDHSKAFRRGGKVDIASMIHRFGHFEIPISYYNVFHYMGSFLSGTHSILMNWAQFSVDRSNRNLQIKQVIPYLWATETEGRNTRMANQIFMEYQTQNGKLECVWSGKRIGKSLNIDHMIPFSIWENNDLWNLLPATPSENNRKRDKIPSPELISRRSDQILSYWNLMRDKKREAFEREMNISLIGNQSFEDGAWEGNALESLLDKCSYLIETRGFEVYDGPLQK